MLSRKIKKVTSILLATLLSASIFSAENIKNVSGTEKVVTQPSYGYEIETEAVQGTDLILQKADYNEGLLQAGGLSIGLDATLQAIDPKLEKTIYDGIVAHSSSISFAGYSMTFQEAFDAYLAVVNKNGDLFHAKSGMSASTMNGKVISITPNYAYSKTETTAMKVQFDAEVDKVKNIITPDMSDLEIALTVNDYLAMKVDYDIESYSSNTIPADSFNAYGTLVLDVAVCQGYALTYRYLMEKIFGIPTEYVVSDTMNHAWNMVNIDGSYYHVDVTWNDPYPSGLGSAWHHFFLLSDSEITNRDHADWESNVSASSTRFDGYFWDELEAPFARILDKFYYVDEEANLVEWDVDSNTKKVLIKLEDKWYYETYSYYYGAYHNVFSARGKLFFNQPDGIYSLDIDGSNLKKEHAVGSIKEGLPYSFEYKDGQFRYSLSSSPYPDESVPVKVAPINLGPAVSEVQILKESLTLLKGQSIEIVANVLPDNAMNSKVSWKSSNGTVATVSEGKITAHTTGESIISVSSIDGNKTDFIKVTVMPQEFINDLEVLSGANRYATAVEISKSLYDAADTAILVLGTDFPDALAAGPLAMKYNAPVLLSQKTRISATTLDEIIRLKVKNVILLGGEAVISEEVTNMLKDAGISNITRIAGKSRYETAARAAENLAGGVKKSKVILASGENFADALSVGSYASREGIPILLTKKGSLPTATEIALKTLMVEEVLILGGASAVDDAVAEEVKAINPQIQITRIQGASRYSTAVEVSSTYFGESTEAIIASGVEFADALAAAPYAAKKNLPILLVSSKTVSTVLGGFLNDRFTHLHVIGGDAAIGETVRTDLLVQINQK